MREIKYKRGDVILQEGSIGNSAYLIHGGRVEISKRHLETRVVLKILGKGEIFGEMSLIDEKPRSGTATALEDCILEEITAEGISEMLQNVPPPIRFLLNTLVERIRNIDEQILKTGISLDKARITSVTLFGVSEKAREALAHPSLKIARFPFGMGRSAAEPWFSSSKNDLVLHDSLPYHVSRCHCSIIRHHEDLFVVDQGSTLGTIVNGHRIGGGASAQSILCEHEENRIIVGSPDSPFQFRLSIKREGL